MTVYLLFIDGVGLGEKASYNPWYTEPTPGIHNILGSPLVREAAGRVSTEVLLLSTDACLGVEGLPQSATGQATIFTGRNAPQAMGEHQSGLPFRRLREWVQRENLYLRAAVLGWRATFANAYTEEYFHLPKTKRGWVSVSTAAIQSSGQPLRMLDDLLEGNAVYHDLTRWTLAKRRPEVEVIRPEKAAQDLLNIGVKQDLVVHEFFLSDLAGHRQDRELIAKVIQDYDRFLEEIIQRIGSDDTVVLVSDHGNSEDFRFRTHTAAPVPTLVMGRSVEKAIQFTSSRETWDLTGITPLLLHLLSDVGKTKG